MEWGGRDWLGGSVRQIVEDGVRDDPDPCPGPTLTLMLSSRLGMTQLLDTEEKPGVVHADGTIHIDLD